MKPTRNVAAVGGVATAAVVAGLLVVVPWTTTVLAGAAGLFWWVVLALGAAIAGGVYAGFGVCAVAVVLLARRPGDGFRTVDAGEASGATPD